MIVGIGTDILQIARIAHTQRQHGERFAMRILSTIEFARYHQHPEPVRFLAKRFAAKEACAKALGTGISGGVSFHDFTIVNNDLGKPDVSVTGKAKLLCDEQFARLHVTLSDEKEYVVAFAVLSQIFSSASNLRDV